MNNIGQLNFFRTFQGVYPFECTYECDSKNLMLSCVEDVQFLGNITLKDYVGDNIIGVLPNECAPKYLTKFPIAVGNQIDILTINSNGEFSLANSYQDDIIYLCGVSFNVSNRWYK